MNNSLPALPHLELLPIRDLLEHERHDNLRTDSLITRMVESGVLRNPPIVTPLQDNSQRFMILDGANRVAVLQKLEFPHAVVQIVNADDPGLKLYNWNHVVWGFNPAELLASINQLSEASIVTGDRMTTDSSIEQSLAKFETAQGEQYTICSAARDLASRVRLLNAIVDIYRLRASLDRTSEWSVVRLISTYANLCGLVIFPKFELQQVLSLAGQGCLLPTGITRFTVSPRVLHLNYPLAALQGPESIESKQQDLQNFLQQRISQKGVRFYAEATYMFDE
ncbi:MAG: hypothetical protein ACK2UM_04940 [Anaerolineales bacterium]